MRRGDIDPPLSPASQSQQRWQEAAGAYAELPDNGLQTASSGWFGESRARHGRYALALRTSRPLWSPGRPLRRWRGGAIRRVP